MELVAGLSLSLLGSGLHDGYSYRKPPQPPVVVNILPPCNCRGCRGTKKKKKKKIKKKKPYPGVGRRYPWLTNDGNDRYPSLAAAAATGRQNIIFGQEQTMSATAMGARGNSTSTYCRRTRHVYESEEEIGEEESDDEEEESESDDDESEESDEEEEESDDEETVHHQLRSRRAYY